MQTVAIEQAGGPEVLVDKEMPLPKPGRNEVRIKVKAIGFNPVDYKIRSGEFGKSEYPLVMGIDCSGVIDAVGDKEHGLSVGDEVYAFCFFQGSNGSYAEYVCVPSQFVAKKPKNLSFEEAAAVPVTYLTAFQALIGSRALEQDRPIFIAGGSGGVGSAAIALAQCYKGGPIFTTAGSDESAQYLTSTFNIPEKQILRYKGMNFSEMENVFRFCLL